VSEWDARYRVSGMKSGNSVSEWDTTYGVSGIHATRAIGSTASAKKPSLDGLSTGGSVGQNPHASLQLTLMSEHTVRRSEEGASVSWEVQEGVCVCVCV
jgi:hypothetical protein